MKHLAETEPDSTLTKVLLTLDMLQPLCYWFVVSSVKIVMMIIIIKGILLPIPRSFA